MSAQPLSVRGEGGRRRARRGLVISAAVGAMGILPGISRASTIRSDTSDSEYVSLGAESQYAASGFLYVALGMEMGGEEVEEASGTLIAPGWILTAAHAATQDTTGFPTYSPSQFSFGQGSSASYPGPDSISSVAVESGWNFNSNQGNDLALLQLSSPILNVTPAPLYTSSLGSELGQVATIVGYGTSGTGTTGNTGPYGTRQGIQNDIDTFGGGLTTGGPPSNTVYSWSNYSSNLMLTDFDEPGDPSVSLMGGTTPLTLEGASTAGDSGGGLFLTVGSTTYLAGVTSFEGPSTNAEEGLYGCFNGYTRVSVSQSVNFIDSVLSVACSWSNSGSGNWSNPGNWASGNIPQFASATANFTSAITSNSTVTVDDAWTVGTINFSNNNSYTLAPSNGGEVVMQVNSGSAAINDSQGNHFISAPIVLNNNTTVSIASSGNTLDFSGNISGTGGLSLTGSGALILTASNSYSGNTTVSGGHLILQASQALPTNSTLSIGSSGAVQLATGSGGQTLSSISISSGGSLDVGNNHLIINYGSSDPKKTILGYLATGSNSGNWNGAGIKSSAAASNPNYGVGFSDGADGLDPNLGSEQIEVAYAQYGDITMQGLVNAADFHILATNFGQVTTLGWEAGDFLYQGVVNAQDFHLLAENFGQTASGEDVAISPSDMAAFDAFAAANGLDTPSAVPEPAALGIVAIGSMVLLRRRRQARMRPAD